MRSTPNSGIRLVHVIRRVALLVLLFVATAAYSVDSNQPVQHQIEIQLQPERGRLIATDTITLPGNQREVEFLLHADLIPTLNDRDAHLASMERLEGPVPLRRYRIQTSIPRNTYAISYQGTIRHPLAGDGERGNPRQSTPGLISADGVFLAGSSFWYPQIGAATVSFRMRAQLPAGWRSVSQGSPLAGQAGWQEPQPQDEIYLIAYPYHHYKRQFGERLAEVYLRQPDPALAERYLQATGEYLAFYDELLGPYPYAKFALVENFWESGYGMPSFTLLGPRVIQLPFIIHSSYPHEILHNWWGNGVYVDATSGNWSEGLTTYLADHLLKERHGEGAAYRRTTLQSYADYVARQDDFPLARFRGNHGQISQSVGYGKTLMLFHMLRMELGDPLFLEGLRQFYREYRFRKAGFDELRASFETVAGRGLGDFFEQWLNRTGAPTLTLAAADFTPLDQEYRLRIRLRQTQPEKPYRLTVPIFVHFADSPQAVPYRLEMQDREATLEIRSPKRPLKVSVDPRFDLFRRLDPSETPSSLGQLFGAKRLYAVLPAAADRETRQAYARLLKAWQQRQPGLTLLRDGEIEQLPENEPVWVLGRDNRFAGLFERPLAELGPVNRPGTIALTHRQDTGATLGYIDTDRPEALAGLSRKLPHYGRSSYALFDGDEPAIKRRGEWPIADSALSRQLVSSIEHRLTAIPDHRPLSEADR